MSDVCVNLTLALVYDDILLACDFYVFFSLFKLVFFFQLSKQDIPSTFHVNICSFLIFRELEPLTYQPHSNFQQGTAMFNVYSFLSSAATRVARL